CQGQGSARVLLHHAALDHDRDGLEQAHVGGRVAGDGDEVGPAAHLGDAHVLAVKGLGRVDGRGLDRLQRRHAVTHHPGELAAVVAVRVHARVGAVDHAHAGRVGAPEALALDVGDLAVLAQVVLEHAV